MVVAACVDIYVYACIYVRMRIELNHQVTSTSIVEKCTKRDELACTHIYNAHEGACECGEMVGMFPHHHHLMAKIKAR
jgi:hypothetical protein